MKKLALFAIIVLTIVAGLTLLPHDSAQASAGPSPTGDIFGSITGPAGGPARFSNVKLFKSGALIAEMQANSYGNYKFEDLPYGYYRVVATNRYETHLGDNYGTLNSPDIRIDVVLTILY